MRPSAQGAYLVCPSISGSIVLTMTEMTCQYSPIVSQWTHTKITSNIVCTRENSCDRVQWLAKIHILGWLWHLWLKILFLVKKTDSTHAWFLAFVWCLRIHVYPKMIIKCTDDDVFTIPRKLTHPVCVQHILTRGREFCIPVASIRKMFIVHGTILIL